MTFRPDRLLSLDEIAHAIDRAVSTVRWLRARRRFFPSPETESAKQLYQALIVAGVGVAFIGIFSTSYLAITQGIKEPFDAWIAGSIYF